MNFLNYKEEQNLALLDEEFLASLAEQKERDMYAKIISLDVNENSIDEIQGKVTGGSVNIDGTSSVRRTCSLTVIAQDVEINDYYWGLKTKFKLEIGLKNKLSGDYSANLGRYPDIVWFPMGTFILTAFNTSLSTNSITISLSGKDKMSMLNGDLGGQLFASIDFGTEETLTNVFKEAAIEPVDSDVLMQHDYYIAANTAPTGTEISSKDPIYKFEPSASGNWFFLNNNYVYNLDQRNRKLYTGTYYFRYERVLNPEFLFEPVNFNDSNLTYQPNQFYYQKYEDEPYFVLNKTGTWITPRSNNYQRVGLYELTTEYSIKKIPLEKIIREAVHAYAKEPYHNIIINDLNSYGLEQLSYRGDTPLLIFKNRSTGHFTQVALITNFVIYNNQNRPCHFEKNDQGEYQLTDGNSNVLAFSFNSELSDGRYIQLDDNHQWKYNISGNDTTKQYSISIVNFGDDVGYRITDLVYTGDLISSIGETLTSILDKIKNMLGDFEYFYDTDGRFIFQKKRSYVNTAWSQFVNNEDEKYVTFSNDKRKFSFNFEGNRLFTAIQNTPVLTNLRNDYSVWGKRKTASGAEIPIHARYAIDRKPVFYRAFDGVIYTTDRNYATKESLNVLSYDQIADQVRQSLSNFQLEYPIINSNTNRDIELFGAKINQAIPTKTTDENGNPTWTPGWWDIRDWARYYQLLTGQIPQGTMKWYSHGKFNSPTIHPEDIEIENSGSVSYSDIAYLKEHLSNVQDNNDPRRVWLLEIIYDNNNNISYVSTTHGGGTPRPAGGNRTPCNYYKHGINQENNYLYDEILTQEEEANKKKYFNIPYAGCADSHTYTYFQQIINNTTSTGTRTRVLFYNPDFPYQNLQELIEQQIEITYEDQYNSGIRVVDWREIIYRMALDYFAGQGCSESKPLYIKNESGQWEAMENPDYFLSEVAKRNIDYYPTGYTGYEQYYTDMEGFWRELYNPDYVPEPVYQKGQYATSFNRNDDTGYYTKTTEWQHTEIVDYNVDYYVGQDLNPNGYTEFLTYIQGHYDADCQQYFISSNESQASIASRSGWNKLVFENPEQLNFWIDFLDEGEELSQFQIAQVGDRSKVVNEDRVSAIIFKEIPDLILYDTRPNPEDESQVPDRTALDEQTGYTWIYLPRGFSQFLSISYRSLSAKNKIDELLYQFAYCIENISLTAIPVYQLQPNTRIYVCDPKTKIEGEYIVTKITYAFKYDGTMNITAVKAPERLY